MKKWQWAAVCGVWFFGWTHIEVQGSVFPPGPTFDCEKASTDSQRLICSNGNLSLNDRYLGRVFANAVNALDNRRWQIVKTYADIYNDINRCEDGEPIELPSCIISRYFWHGKNLERLTEIINNDDVDEVSVTDDAQKHSIEDKLRHTLKAHLDDADIVSCKNVTITTSSTTQINFSYGASCTIIHHGEQRGWLMCDNEMSDNFSIKGSGVMDISSFIRANCPITG